MKLRQSPTRPTAHPPTPAPNPERITAVWLMRWSESPDDPLRIVVDHALLNHMNWRPGDRIAFEAIPLDRPTRRGGLIIRRANPEEPAITLEAASYVRRPNHPHPALAVGPDGPDVQWRFPGDWVATFFPHLYLAGGECHHELDRDWPLSELLDQRDRITLSLDCSDLDFPLQRADATTLNVHLQPGLLRLMDWSSTTPLVLESESGFDPFAEEDRLTIREPSLGEEPNLTVSADRWTVEVNPLWLDRFLPDVFDDSEPDLPASPRLEAESDSTAEEPRAYRDTVVVDYGEMTLKGRALSFEIARPSPR